MMSLIINNNVKAIKQQLLLYCFCIIQLFSFAQSTPNNLVTNYSFEERSCCPITPFTPINCDPLYWYGPDKGGAVYYNTCANNTITGIPFNAGGGGQNFQYARTGNGYMAMYYYNGMDSRNYVQIKLSDSLRNGRCYYAEYYINLLNTMRLGTNNQSMLFTNNPVYVDTISTPYGVLPANPQIQNPFIVTDTLNWVKIAGVFTAQGGEQYLTLGNFKNNAQTATQQIQTTGYLGAGYYIEDVTVVPLDSVTLQADAGLDKSIIVGDSVFIGSFTTGLNNVTWYNSTGNIIANNVSGLFVKPTTSTFYVIEQTVCGQYSRDTVYITVGVVPLVIKDYELKIKNEGVVNKWTTLNEINVSHFNIQHSSNGRDFYTLQKVNAKNNAYNEYTVSVIPLLGGGGAYRIEAADKDGKVTYSKTLSITINHKPQTVNIYPNPANSIVNISFKEMQQVIITDIAGRVLLNKPMGSVSNTQINISTIGKGIFFVRVIGKDGSSETKKLIVQ